MTIQSGDFKINTQINHGGTYAPMWSYNSLIYQQRREQ